ncbi:protein POLLEN DEFECTIVE IN GUIDANCE 1-like isoform X2 [Hibiscus syriacus]|uniref:protein POLLEN DEFECTIVE IN GUIDANCE 1-like isoform X2 n=1 Tax=Hibiscus syriacus TaxID=106335 RepID=UPI001922708F|nr:protein POLLEN DEFECTIVE IN GUIDANCE 1-like isoform X2 [Hibiscus syriacus]
MALKSSGRRRQLSFEILSQSSSVEGELRSSLHRSGSDPTELQNGVAKPSRSSRKKKRQRKRKEFTSDSAVIPEDPVAEKRGSSSPAASVLDSENYGIRDNGSVNRISYVGDGSVVVMEESVCQNVWGFGELRQRNVIGGGEETEKVASRTEEGLVGMSIQKDPLPPASPQPVANANVAKKLETAESLDWKRLMSEDPNFLYSLEKSPAKYFLDEMYSGNSLRRTTTFGSEKERERVYDTIFRLPWRCEVLIDVGFFVCFDSFLSLLTIMPTRIMIKLWRFLATSSRGFLRQSCVILAAFLFWPVESFSWDKQGTIKLYVVYNVFEIFDKLCQNFGGGVFQTLFNSAEGLANCSQENMRFWIRRFVSDQALAMAFSILHSFILLAQAITLSTCIVAHNNALFALLVSNNFAEIKSNAFKRFSKDNIHNLAYADSIERFHISAFLVSVLAQNILEAQSPWFESFFFNAFVVFFCEMLIDIIKHSFLAKFNGIKPIEYSEFLEDLCKQTLNMQTEDNKKNLTFVPLAPACVVVRVLTPVYAAHLPYSPLPWRHFWILFLISVTYIMLTSLKVMIGMGLKKHATWYVDRCRKRKHHLHFE